VPYHSTLDHVPTYFSTHIPQNLHTPTHIPLSTGTGIQTMYIPSNPTIHFGNTSPFVLVPDTQHSFSPCGGLSSTPIQDNHSHFYDTPFDTTVDIKTQSIGNPMDVGLHQGASLLDHTTSPVSNIHHAFHVGCQTTIDPPSLEVKEQKKLSFPPFDPQKMSFQNSSSLCWNCTINSKVAPYLFPSLNAQRY